MSEFDRMIEDALDQEDQEVRRLLGEEPGFFELALGAMRGRGAWANWMIMIAQAGLFIGGVWAAWEFFHAEETLAALRWGLPAATLLVLSLVLKMGLVPVMQADRVMREIKRAELRIERLREEAGDAR